MSPSPAPISTCSPVYIDIYVYSSAFKHESFCKQFEFRNLWELLYWCSTLDLYNKAWKWEYRLAHFVQHIHRLYVHMFIVMGWTSIYSFRWARNVTLWYNSTSFFDPVLWSAGSGRSADITPFWVLLASLPDATPSSKVLPASECWWQREWFLVPESSHWSLSLGAPGLCCLTASTAQHHPWESSLCCVHGSVSHRNTTQPPPWNWPFLFAPGTLALFPLFLLPGLVYNPSVFMLSPSILCSWLLGTEAGVSSWRVHLHPPETLDLDVNRMGRELVEKWKNTSKINPVLSGPRCVCFILWELLPDHHADGFSFKLQGLPATRNQQVFTCPLSHTE